MTWKDICERYPNQWVALVDMDEDPSTYVGFNVARVAGHGVTSRAPFEQMRAAGLHYYAVGHFFTGPIVAFDLPFPRCSCPPLDPAGSHTHVVDSD